MQAIIGQSHVVDFALYAGLGVCAACTVLISLLAPVFVGSMLVAPWKRTLLISIARAILIGSLLAVSALMGAISDLTVGAASDIGFAIGALATLAVAWAVQKKRPNA